MTVDQAMGLVSQICAGFHGTLNDHQMIQQALAVLEQAIKHKQPVVEPQAAEPAATAQK